MSNLEELATKAVQEPIRTPPPLGRVRAAVVRRRRRRRRLVGAMASVVVVAVGVGGAAVFLTGFEDAERLGTAAATQIPDAPTGEGQVTLDPPPSPAPDQPLSADVAAATPARLLREAQTRLGDSVVIIWRLTERGSIDGRCLDLTAFVDGAVHSRGGSCSRSPNRPSSSTLPVSGFWPCLDAPVPTQPLSASRIHIHRPTPTSTAPG